MAPERIVGYIRAREMLESLENFRGVLQLVDAIDAIDANRDDTAGS